ncbi:SidJ-related pseudokinase [Desulfohalovibrio reitneri]|uniref:SidJ-related pseudokinase n=1 Tax=Desulfohalovibrio reitneri TaxID=1307759 RepID=UPI00068CAA88|nr:SidJ-related pseudokinase [Desulfohalovibrio reitneri]
MTHYYPEADAASRAIQKEFSATYLSARSLREEVARDPSRVPEQSVRALELILNNFGHDAQRNAHYLYREAAQGVACLLGPESGPEISQRAMNTLSSLLREGTRKARLAVAGVLGELDPGLGRMRAEPEKPDPGRSRRTAEVLSGVDLDGRPRRAGRSLLFPLADGDLAVLKLAKPGEDPAGLALEAAWMSRLEGADAPVSFQSPEVLDMVRLSDPPVPGMHQEGWCLAYRCRPDYFAYPNELPCGSVPDPEDFEGMMARSARLFGWLASRGVVHDAPIPLFHNRTAQGRRADEGVYQWRRMGRLDRWLESCRHPNFGRTGPRDFEHLVPVRTGAALHEGLGSLFLSMGLVAGSYFRARDRSLVGLDARDEPVDARHLFDLELLERVMRRCFTEFHHGFRGSPWKGRAAYNTSWLAKRMIGAMGVDSHMTEVLRVVDQEEMDDRTFVDFLVARGVDRTRAEGLKRGADEIELVTGPHLGRFNNLISLPELIEYAAACSAQCIGGRALDALRAAPSSPEPREGGTAA